MAMASVRPLRPKPPVDYSKETRGDNPGWLNLVRALLKKLNCSNFCLLPVEGAFICFSLCSHPSPFPPSRRTAASTPGCPLAQPSARPLG